LKLLNKKSKVIISFLLALRTIQVKIQCLNLKNVFL